MSTVNNFLIRKNRMVDLNNLGPESRDKVLESCRKLLRSSGFLFKDQWARVIPDKTSLFLDCIVSLRN